MLFLRSFLPRSALPAAKVLAVAAATHLALMAMTDPAAAQRKPAVLTEGASKERMNQNTVGIVAGKSDSAFLSAVEDLTTVLDDGDNLRVLAILGKGAAQNVRDTLFLRNMDMGITQSNVLAYFKKSGELGPNVEGRLVYIAKLFNEEVHVIAGPGVNDLRDLAGKTVSFGEVGSGTELTARLVFESLKIDVKPVSLGVPDALAAIRRGDVAAAVLLTGKPSGALAKARAQGGELKLLSIPFEEALEQDYLPTRLSSADYPDLIAEGESVETVAVSAVLAAYNWPQGSDRHRRLSRFVEAFFSKFPELRKEPRHPKWREVNLLADVPGWQRFAPAKQWLDNNGPARRPAEPAVAGGPAGAQKKNFEQFLAAQRKAGAPGVPQNAAAQQAMFQKFLEWMSTQNGGQSAGAPAAAPGAAGQSGGGGGAAPAGPRLW
ncbi:MAG: TAXI family TRAP transporter solute-binding subunit [Hyphomicrobium sp.]